NEAMRGTLEQLSMSPMGIWRIITTRLASSMILNFLLIIILLYASMLTTGQWLNLDVVTILPILILTLISMCGLGFIIAGMSIVLKQVQAFLEILQFMLAGLTFVPLPVAPFWPFVFRLLMCMCGLGCIIAGMSIVLKQVQAFLQILQFMLAGLTFVPLTVAPFLAFFPFVKGVDLVRDVMIDGVTLSQIGVGDFSILIVNAVV